MILNILNQIIALLSFCILFLGLFGNVLNIVVFTSHKSFRKNQCVFYMTIESIVNCCQLLIIFASRIAISVFNYDPMQKSLVWCKLRSMIAPVGTLISMSIVCLAVVDQYFSTHYSVRIRAISTLHSAQIWLGIVISVWLLYGISFVLFFEIRPIQGCNVYQLEFATYYRFFHLPILIGALPLSVGAVFSLLAYRNVRHLIRRQLSHLRRRLDRQLTAMVLVRVIFMIVVTVPFVIDRIYTLTTSSDLQNNLQREIEALVLNATISMFTLNFAVRFLTTVLRPTSFFFFVHYL